jgi:hypothetical protein
MRPEPKNFNGSLLGENLVNETMLEINTARVGACEITQQLLQRWRHAKGITCKQSKQRLNAWAKASLGG